MPERCKRCEQYEKRQKDAHERRVNLWRRGELTDAAAEKLTSEEQRIDQELKQHRAAEHAYSPLSTAETLATESHPNLEEEIRRLAFELYVERGREDGHDLDDWLHAEAEVKGTAVKAAA